MTKTQIRVVTETKTPGELMKTYFPEKRGALGFWFGILVSNTADGGDIYHTDSLREAKRVIDAYLQDQENTRVQTIVEYPIRRD